MKRVDNISKDVTISTNPMTHAMNRKVLSDFIAAIPKTSGWWYRLPQLNLKATKSNELYTETYLPHLGAIFGLDEEATAIIMFEMGLISIGPAGNSRIKNDGWDDLKSLFDMWDNVDVSKCRIQTPTGREQNVFVKIGRCNFTPSQIVKNKKYPPSKLVTRKTTAFVCTQLMDILRQSNKFSLLLGTRYYCDDTTSIQKTRTTLNQPSMTSESNSNDKSTHTSSSEQGSTNMAPPIASNSTTNDANNVASNIEIQEVCQQYGSLCIILDSVISYIYNINDIFTDDQIEELETRLFRLLKDWKKLLLSFTPKMHVLLDHMTDQVKYIKGFTTMGEDRLERSHQWRFKVAMCLLRVRDEVKKMNIQAKQQHRQNMKEVQDIQQKVNVASTRKNKKRNLKVEKDMIKKKSREDKRDEKINESLDHIIIKDSRESIKDKIRNTNHNGRSDRN